jgi:galactokinase/mevalonate kinase-like predicted kinase
VVGTGDVEGLIIVGVGEVVGEVVGGGTGGFVFWFSFDNEIVNKMMIKIRNITIKVNIK